MAKTDLKLNATGTDGKATTATITYVNPEASNSQLATLGRMLNNLTDNTYGTTLRINTIDCETEGGGSKQTPTFTVSPSTISLADFTTNYFRTLTLSYDGDATRFWVNISGTGTQAGLLTAQGVWNNNGTLMSQIRATEQGHDFNPTADLVVTYRVEETDNFQAAEATCTITV